jgi:hypothetical protein
MTQPFVIVIPHQLGQAEAIARLKFGLNNAEVRFGRLITFQEREWSANRLQFRLSALAQSISGTIDVFDDHVRLEIVPSRGTISHVAPLARAVTGHGVGEAVEIGGEEAVILKIAS